MTKPVKSKINQDHVLSDFTDHILDGKTPELAPASDEELRALEEIVLRLNQAFPQHGVMDEKTVKRMQADFKDRKREANASTRPAFWWSQQTRQRFALVLAVAVIVVIILATIPLFTSGTGSVQASAGLHPQNIGLLVLLFGGIFFLVVWLGRRRK